MIPNHDLKDQIIDIIQDMSDDDINYTISEVFLDESLSINHRKIGIPGYALDINLGLNFDSKIEDYNRVWSQVNQFRIRLESITDFIYHVQTFDGDIHLEFNIKATLDEIELGLDYFYQNIFKLIPCVNLNGGWDQFNLNWSIDGNTIKIGIEPGELRYSKHSFSDIFNSPRETPLLDRSDWERQHDRLGGLVTRSKISKRAFSDMTVREGDDTLEFISKIIQYNLPNFDYDISYVVNDDMISHFVLTYKGRK